MRGNDSKTVSEIMDEVINLDSDDEVMNQDPEVTTQDDPKVVDSDLDYEISQVSTDSDSDTDITFTAVTSPVRPAVIQDKNESYLGKNLQGFPKRKGLFDDKNQI